MSYLALVIIVSVVSTEVARFLIHKHSKNFAHKIKQFRSTRWTRSVDGSLIEKEYFGQPHDYEEERALPCFAEELVDLLQLKQFTSSTAGRRFNRKHFGGSFGLKKRLEIPF